MPRGIACTRNEFDHDGPGLLARIEREVGLPAFVKPVHQGSSVGASPADTPEELLDAIETAFFSDNVILVEELLEGRELTVGVLDDPKTGVPGGLPLVEIRPIGPPL